MDRNAYGCCQSIDTEKGFPVRILVHEEMWLKKHMLLRKCSYIIASLGAINWRPETNVACK